jgi:hypothetical protein
MVTVNADGILEVSKYKVAADPERQGFFLFIH